MFVVLDTDVASVSHLGRLPPSLAARLVRTVPCLTFVTYGELIKWINIRSWGDRNRWKLTDWMDRRPILGYDEAVAATRGQLSAAAQRRGRPVAPNDTWIAACRIAADLPLATLNLKDYLDFAEHHGLQLVRA